MRAEIISVGTELLLGDILNTNARFLSQELAALGYTVYYQTVVGDNALRLRALLQEAKERSDVLVLTGGLGPTEDDLTKETVAEVFGDYLVPDAEELAKINAYFKARGRQMSENNRKQAMVPRSGRKLPNENGTAPGAFFRQGRKYAFLLPGPPAEMEPMFQKEVRPLLEAMQDASIRSLTLRVVGMGESDLEVKVASLLEGDNPTAALYAKTGEVHIRITAKADTADMADVMCAEYADLFRKLLGDLIYSDSGDDLETTVVEALIAHDETIATAESCTGGLLSERITSVPGASAVFGFGAVTYANEVKHELVGVSNRTLRRYGAVSSQVAAEMAYGAARRGVTDYGVGITGIAGPDGGSEQKPVGLVYIAVSMGGQVFIRKMTMHGRSRDVVRYMATQNALDMVRLLIAGKPVPDAKQFSRSQQADYERVGRPKHKAGFAGRALGAVLLVALILALILGALYFSRGTPEEAADMAFPAAQGLRYGTPEYTAAAEELVAQTAAENPSVVGFVALPYPQVEGLVAQAAVEQAALDEAPRRAGNENMALVASTALPARTPANTVVLGGETFTPLLKLADTEQAKQLSTFTYYTSRDAKVYTIFAVFLVDENETQPDGFDPAATSLAPYEDFLTFALGTKMRSLYEVGALLAQGDSFMSLAVADPAVAGRTLYVCGRLMPPEESVEVLPPATVAGAPLMPAAYYQAGGKTPPDTAALYTQWLGWYINQGAENQQLQYLAGMPAADAVPLVPVPVEVAEAESDATASETGSSSSAAGTAQGNDIWVVDTSAKNGLGPALAMADAVSSSVSVAGSSSAVSSTAASTVSGASSTGQSDSDSAADAASEAPEEAPEEVTAEPEPEPPEFVRADPALLTVTMNGVRVTDPVADVLAQICQQEAASVSSPEAIKALAVAAHSWILNQQAAGDAAPAVRGMSYTPEVYAAVAEVAAVVVSADEEAPAFTPFFALAAKGTNEPDAVWGVSRAYLKTVPSRYDQGLADWRRIYTLEAEEVSEMLEAALGMQAPAGVPPEGWITDIVTNDGGYVTSMQVFGTEVSGSWFWQRGLVKDGKQILRSPAFEMEYTGGEFVITCYGSGHGCGMSLAGAEGQAREGKSYEQILAWYYPDTKLIPWE